MKEMVLVACVMLLLSPLSTALSHASDQPGIPPETVTDYIHAVIEADRTFYTIHVVERLQKSGTGAASEDWRAKKNLLPLPAQFLRESGELGIATGSKVRYRLISLWPINPDNSPSSESEKKGLEAVIRRPERSATATVKEGSQTYFQAIYADHAVTQACVACHNAHPKSSKKDFKLKDVMGGLVIEIPLNQE
jgi:hypothetical protein